MGDVGSHIPKGCRSQANERVVIVFRLLSVTLVVSLLARSLVVDVYAAEPSKFSIVYSSGNGLINSSNSPADLYGGLTISEVDVRKYFTTGSDLVFTLDDIVYKSYTLEGPGSVAITDTSFSDSIIMRYTPVGGGSAATITIKRGEQVSVSYGGGSLSFSYYPSCGRLTTSSASISSCKITTETFFTVPAQPLSDNEALNEINDKMQEQIDQQDRYHQEEIDKGDQSGSDASQMVDDLTDQVKTKWEILFYPIEFTQKFLALFTSSGSGSTAIEFPAFSLEVDGQSYQVWDSYTYDLGTLESDFSILFTGLHMVVGVIEVGWFIRYLYRKYDEVFGSGGGDQL